MEILFLYLMVLISYRSTSVKMKCNIPNIHYKNKIQIKYFLKTIKLALSSSHKSADGKAAALACLLHTLGT